MSLRTSPQTGAAIRNPLHRPAVAHVGATLQPSIAGRFVGRNQCVPPIHRTMGMRIAAPVCGLVRNDIFGGFSYSPNPFIPANACLRVDVGIDPYNRLPIPCPINAGGVEPRPYEIFANLSHYPIKKEALTGFFFTLSYPKYTPLRCCCPSGSSRLWWGTTGQRCCP